jgi:hypothetical protein
MKIIKTTVGLILAASLIFATGCSQKNNSSNGKDNANAKKSPWALRREPNTPMTISA